MPTYAYACTECKHRFEIVQSFSEDSLTECPECQGRLRKLFNAVGIVFKGSGFYRNDSRNDSRNETRHHSRRGTGNASQEGTGRDSESGSGPASLPAASGSPSSSTPAHSSAGEGTTKAAKESTSNSEGTAA